MANCKLSWVRGNDVVLNVTLTRMTETGETEDFILDECDEWAAKVYDGLGRDVGCETWQSGRNVISLDLQESLAIGSYSVEVTALVNGRDVRAYETDVFRIVGSNGLANVTLDAQGGEASADLDLTFQVLPQVITEGKNSYQLWREAGNEGSLQDYIDGLIETHSITPIIIDGEQHADIIGEDYYVYHWQNGRYVKTDIYVKGPKGDKGDTGDTGATGADGRDGAPGAAGSPGAAGAKGDKGDTGETGAKGDKMTFADLTDAEKKALGSVFYVELQGTDVTVNAGEYANLGLHTGDTIDITLVRGLTGYLDHWQVEIETGEEAPIVQLPTWVKVRPGVALSPYMRYIFDIVNDTCDVKGWGMSSGGGDTAMDGLMKQWITNTLQGEIIVPEGVTTIPQYKFAGMSQVSKVVLPEGVNSIGTYAFSGCSNCKEINMPKTLTSIQAHAFSSCYVEKFILPKGMITLAQNALTYAYGLRNATIPPLSNTIGNYMLQNCSNLRNVVWAYESAFPTGTFSSARSGIKIVMMKNSVIPYSTDGGNSAYHLYVPDHLEASYKATTGWAAMSSRIHPISEITDAECLALIEEAKAEYLDDGDDGSWMTT